MDLRQWVDTECGGNAARGARRLGVTRQAMHQWMTGAELVAPSRALEIERLTGGKVTRPDLRPDLFGGLKPTREWLREVREALREREDAAA